MKRREMKREEMKRKKWWVLIVGLCLIAGGCTAQEPEEKSRAESSGESSVSSEEEASQESSEEEKHLLEQTFGEMWEKPSYEITTDMIVETKGLEASEGDSSVSEYHYELAVDRRQNRGMVRIVYPDQSIWRMIIKGGLLYNVNEKEKIYSTQEFEEPIGSFGESWTKKLSLGVTDNLVYDGGGAANFYDPIEDKTVELEYETYRMNRTASEDASEGDDMTITYYFKEQKPYAETMETSKGKTTFLFRHIAEEITDQSVFSLGEEYTEAEDIRTPS